MGFHDTFKIYYDENDPIYWLNKARNVFAKGAVVETGIWFKRCLETN